MTEPAPAAPLEAVLGLTEEEVNEVYNTFDQTPSVGYDQKRIRANVQAKLVNAVQNANALAQAGAVVSDSPEQESEVDPAPQPTP
jgi:hypothetical protein